MNFENIVNLTEAVTVLQAVTPEETFDVTITDHGTFAEVMVRPQSTVVMGRYEMGPVANIMRTAFEAVEMFKGNGWAI